MKKSHVLGLVLVASTLAGTAVAGLRETRRINIDIMGRRADGALGSTRNSSQATEYIQCTMSGNAASNSLTCLATDPDGRQATCYLNNPPQTFLNVLDTLQGDSYLSFLWEYPSQKCIGIIVSNGSRYEPKVLAAPSSATAVF